MSEDKSGQAHPRPLGAQGHLLEAELTAIRQVVGTGGLSPSRGTDQQELRSHRERIFLGPETKDVEARVWDCGAAGVSHGSAERGEEGPGAGESGMVQVDLTQGTPEVRSLCVPGGTSGRDTRWRVLATPGDSDDRSRASGVGREEAGPRTWGRVCRTRQWTRKQPQGFKSPPVSTGAW